MNMGSLGQGWSMKNSIDKRLQVLLANEIRFLPVIRMFKAIHFKKQPIFSDGIYSIDRKRQ